MDQPQKMTCDNCKKEDCEKCVNDGGKNFCCENCCKDAKMREEAKQPAAPQICKFC
jgi:hypothetical protein